ncbi:hypothetical protein [Acinetobacter ihumii]|uniref:hypothetical protein n=1 Tax=Acinetobacter ihumii TaxID=2483802 RepID=UPI00103014D7|nr:hypothetical protein [Acinetobacter ihumii]
MKVVAYLHNADLLLEDTKGVAVIGGSRYVLSVGDKVYINEVIDEKARLYEVSISFASADHAMLHEDEVQIKFEGSQEALNQYLQSSTVH